MEYFFSSKQKNEKILVDILQNKFAKFDDSVVKWKFNGELCTTKFLENKQKNENSSKNILISDTNLQVIKIWSKVKYSKCNSFILKNQNPNALYILCKPDFKWIHDPLRENRKNRKKKSDK